MVHETPENQLGAITESDRAQRFPVRRLLILVIGGLGLLTGLVFPFPMTGRYWNTVFDLAHAPAFFLIFLLVAGFLDPASIGFSGSSRALLHLTPRRLLLISGLLFLGGVTCEVAQKFVDRHPSIHDIIANSVGLMAGTLYCLSLRARHRWYRLAGIPLATLILISPSIAHVQELVECVRQRQEFPLLASFERSLELSAWTPHGATVTRDITWASMGSQSMRIESSGDRQPGAVMVWPVPDWSDYSTLKFDLFNPEANAVTVGVTISDEDHVLHLWEPSDRFNWSVKLMPKEVRMIAIELHDVANSPETRSMDLTRVSNLNIFMPNAPQGSKLYVDGILLLK
jgi:hypothetical protein